VRLRHERQRAKMSGKARIQIDRASRSWRRKGANEKPAGEQAQSRLNLRCRRALNARPPLLVPYQRMGLASGGCKELLENLKARRNARALSTDRNQANRRALSILLGVVCECMPRLARRGGYELEAGGR